EAEPGARGNLRAITAEGAADIHRQTTAHGERNSRARDHAALRAPEDRRFVDVRSVVGERSRSLQVCAGTELETHVAQEVSQFAAKSRLNSIRDRIATGRRAARSDECVDLGVADVVELRRYLSVP